MVAAMRPFLLVFLAIGLAACASRPPPFMDSALGGSLNDRSDRPPAHATPPAREIAFSAYPCFGFCPDFTVWVNATGEVRYDGRHFTALQGVHTLPPNPALFQALEALTGSPQLPWPVDDVQPGKGDCSPVATDLPSYALSASSAAGVRGFVFYAGCGGAQAARARALTDAVLHTLAAHGVPTEGIPPDRGAP